MSIEKAKKALQEAKQNLRNPASNSMALCEQYLEEALDELEMIHASRDTTYERRETNP